MTDATTLPRLLRGATGETLTLAQHEALFPRTARSASLLDELDASGLTGRGGAAFSTAAKARLLRSHRSHSKSVVVNAMEGEPASRKDATMLGANPHLVLDGAEALGSIIGTSDIIICVPLGQRTLLGHVERAVSERLHRGERGASFVIQTPPARYISGEESALTHWLSEQEALPLYRPQRPTVLRVRQRSVLVQNAETCANVGLIAREGADWFRAVGTDASAGSTLVTLSGAVERPQVLEVALGTPLRSLLDAGYAESNLRAVLLGGYGGSWLDGSLLDTPYANEALSPHGATVGAGVVVALGEEGCGITETARIVQWMAGESAQQCGPCAFGLPSLANHLASLASGGLGASDALERLNEHCETISGRSACHHPDGVVRLVRSALEVFRDDAKAHANAQPCFGSTSGRRYARVPGLARARTAS
ncbi:MAG TPA: NADH-ubiquinone oxidoreductase-F iron-sulfur binding region domain-containing protein [Acidimicrobiales bacterium]|jgi:NADH:ubiquinone oxidoreductase subunit F (NADH-binding)|nr:NADH-ubiquinone oxidoreductase-F iron-sulfur binding region domain-containing protein [Acidimicrobiales bacterium]